MWGTKLYSLVGVLSLSLLKNKAHTTFLKYNTSLSNKDHLLFYSFIYYRVFYRLLLDMRAESSLF